MTWVDVWGDRLIGALFLPYVVWDRLVRRLWIRLVTALPTVALTFCWILVAMPLWLPTMIVFIAVAIAVERHGD